MNSKIKNIIISVVVVAVLVLVYIFFIKKGPTDSSALTTTSPSGVPVVLDTTSASNTTANISQDFISLLLSVKSIRLDDTILKDPAFLSLRDSSIVLVQDGNEGRINPFAPIGSENIVTPTSTTPDSTPTDGTLN
jgi:hypothetical protein